MNQYAKKQNARVELTRRAGYSVTVTFLSSKAKTAFIQPIVTVNAVGQLCPKSVLIQTMARAIIRPSVAFNQFLEQSKHD
jgi:hypothetical protein